MKCGTTYLFDHLSQHPEICRCKYKEPHFFSNHEVRDLSRYERLWEWDSAIHKYALEASTSYTKVPAFPNVAERIYQAGISAKFIYLVRNPIERIESHYNFMIKNGQSQRKQKPDSHAIDISRYFMQIGEYYKRFSSDDIIVLNFEELKVNPKQILEKIYIFLDIDPNFIGEEKLASKHTTADIKTQPKFIANTKKINFIKALYRQYLSQETREKLHNFLSYKTSQKKYLSLEEKKMILDTLRDDLTALQTLCGINVEPWLTDL